ncbi:hypothetical protein [Schaalia hyovaginalis]|nr:hypothetical protein [Schaalia hyovaginalis]MDD7554436.1 hypothetical protein [Schaalia hyovaginalis]MDY3093967.1 hypothetical protein [Schaalia hyovaginalis]MDY4491383.1 hypothetical protein [Schaalia hyovaginalis]
MLGATGTVIVQTFPPSGMKPFLTEIVLPSAVISVGLMVRV